MELWPFSELATLSALGWAVLSIIEGLRSWRDEAPERSSGLLSLKGRDVAKCTEDWAERVGDGGWRTDAALLEDTEVGKERGDIERRAASGGRREHREEGVWRRQGRGRVVYNSDSGELGGEICGDDRRNVWRRGDMSEGRGAGEDKKGIYNLSG